MKISLKVMKRGSTSLLERENKSTMSYHLSSTGMANIKKCDNTGGGQMY